jgi:O-acetyl-ADP-ribose deacetylase (regulator of RNase III)
MIRQVQGNLLDADVDALVNTVNTVGVMGKGIALQFKIAFHGNYRAYREACKRGEVRLGRMFAFDAGQLVRPRWVINFPTKQHWKSSSRLKDIDAGLDDLRRLLVEAGIQSVAIPPLGCGNGGLDWADVLPLIERKLDGLDIDILVFSPAGAPHPAEMTNRTARPELSPDKPLTTIAALLDHLYEGDDVDVATVARIGATDALTATHWREGTAVPERKTEQRLLELSAVVDLSRRVLRDEASRLWLRSPNRDLGDMAPLDLVVEGHFE